MSLQFQWTWTVFCGLKQLTISWQMPTYIQSILKYLFIDEMSMLLPSWKAITAYKEQWWNSQCKQYKTTIKPKRLYCFIPTITHLALTILHQSCQKGLVEQPRFLQASRNAMGVGVWKGEGGKLFERKKGTPVDGNLQQSFSICLNRVAESIWNRHSHITSTLNWFRNTQVANAQQWHFTIVARLCLKHTSYCILHRLKFPGGFSRAASGKANYSHP